LSRIKLLTFFNKPTKDAHYARERSHAPMASSTPNIRRFVIDVDKALKTPTLMEIAAAIHGCRGVQSSNITVTEVDQETMGTNVTIEGEHLDYDEIVRAIEHSGAVVHSLDQVVSGERVLEHVPRAR
jgi:uncharacterized protein